MGFRPPSAQSGSVPSETADTFEDYKVILLSSGTVKAIPAAAAAPTTPTGLDVTPRLSSALIAWNPVSGAGHYIVTRSPGGVVSSDVEDATFRDITIEVGETYAYRVQAVDQYGQRSHLTGPQDVFIDPELNAAPTVLVRAWPPEFPTDGRTILRVNARDVDAHALELELEVDEGTIEATDDPSVWIYTPAEA